MTTAREVKKPYIQEKLLPKSAKYAGFDGIDYICIPVEDFGEWFEDAMFDAAVGDQFGDDNSVTMPIQNIRDRIVRGEA